MTTTLSGLKNATYPKSEPVSLATYDSLLTPVPVPLSLLARGGTNVTATEEPLMWFGKWPAQTDAASSVPYRVETADEAGLYGVRLVSDDITPEHLTSIVARVTRRLREARRGIRGCGQDRELFSRPIVMSDRVKPNGAVGTEDLRPAGQASPAGRPATSQGKWVERLAGFSKLMPGWDSYHAVPPSPAAIAGAGDFLAAIDKAALEPSKLNPSVVGGVGFTFRSGGRSVYVEFRNTGNAHAAFIEPMVEPDVVKVDQTTAGYALVIAKVESYLHEQDARGHEA